MKVVVAALTALVTLGACGMEGTNTASIEPSPVVVRDDVRPADVARPPRPGTYYLTLVYHGNSYEELLEIRSVLAAASEVRQTTQRATYHGIDTAVTAWRSDGLYELHSAAHFAGDTYECDWKTPFRVYAFPLRKGSQWTEDDSCTIDGDLYHTHSTSTVRGSTESTIGSHVYVVWVIDTVARNSTSRGKHTSSYDHRITVEFAPDVGLALQTTDNYPYPAGSFTTTTTFESAAPR